MIHKEIDRQNNKNNRQILLLIHRSITEQFLCTKDSFNIMYKTFNAHFCVIIIQ